MKWDPPPPSYEIPLPPLPVFLTPHPDLKLKPPFNWRQKKHKNMDLMHKLLILNEHARFIKKGKLFLLFCKKSQYQNIGAFKFRCTIEFVYVYRITTSTANLFENNLYIFKMLKIMFSRMFDMQY